MEAVQQTIDSVAEQMKAQAREHAAQIKTEKPKRGPRAVAEQAAPEPKLRRPRRVMLPRESAPVAALRKAIKDHEREIKRLNRALKAIGG